MLKAVKIHKSHGSKKALTDITIQFDRGSITGILGPNGAGKTTLFSVLIGICFPDSGDILFNSVNITKMPMHERAKRGLVYLPQDCSIFRGLNVENNIKAILQIKNKDEDIIQKKLKILLEDFSLTHIRKSKAMTLSGGERRKVEIARALASNPRFLLLDEPFAGIDPIAVQEIMEIIKKLKQKGLGIIITDHNVRETLSILDIGFIITEGRVLFSGTSKEITENRSAQEIYLGTTFC